MYPTNGASSAWKAYVDAHTAYDRLLKHLALPILRPASMRLPPPQGRIELERVGLTIRGMTRPIVDNICFVLNPGETIGETRIQIVKLQKDQDKDTARELQDTQSKLADVTEKRRQAESLMLRTDLLA